MSGFFHPLIIGAIIMIGLGGTIVASIARYVGLFSSPSII